MKLDSNNHSVFSMYYHLVFVVKYRGKVFDNEMSDYAKNMFVKLGKKYNISLVDWNHEFDQMHILFKVHPNTELSKFINAYKSTSSRMIKKDFPQVRKKFIERNVLVKEFLSIDYWWFSHRCSKKYIEN